MINYKQWEQHEELSVEEAACLWNEVPPYRYQENEVTDQVKDSIYEKITRIIKKAERLFYLDYIELNHPEIVDGINFYWKKSGDNNIKDLIATDPYRTKFEENIFRAAEKSVRDENINSKTLFYWSYYYRIANSIKEKPLFLYPQDSLAYSDFENYDLVSILLKDKIIKREEKIIYRFYFDDSIKDEEDLEKRLDEIKGIKEKEKELVLNLWKMNKSKEREQKADLSLTQDTNQIKEVNLERSFIISVTEGFRCINWNGQPLNFTEYEAAVIELLYNAYKERTVRVSSRTILDMLGELDKSFFPDKVRNVFTSKDGKKAWGSLILHEKVGKLGYYKLNI